MFVPKQKKSPGVTRINTFCQTELAHIPKSTQTKKASSLQNNKKKDAICFFLVHKQWCWSWTFKECVWKKSVSCEWLFSLKKETMSPKLQVRMNFLESSQPASNHCGSKAWAESLAAVLIEARQNTFFFISSEWSFVMMWIIVAEMKSAILFIYLFLTLCILCLRNASWQFSIC